MMKVSCEDFERGYEDFSGGQLDSSKAKALEEHLTTCPACRLYTQSQHLVRDALRTLPEMKTPPYFWTNLKREINRIESGQKKPSFNASLLPRFASVASGFALALICGFLFLQQGNHQPGFLQTDPSITAERSLQDGASDATLEETSPIDYSQDWLAADNVQIDTSQHRLPEPAGQDSIPIPVEDDFWQLNQVSTTPDDN
ncbi:hypothetical protein CEE37_11195 [candidate division LCP-89 bacterium B3_LCP]|uniref:Zinc-finger domain-containing protein n=1 Tax=candidate division LCP-89 bacterium B3_LCP TaxID=2012998 RepID=A0A532UY28_UNCL8|nr:MAG: hypothetical protein CEE37_11195 [candidate division LCP-89 bacterium B3_LCP]